MTGRGRLAVAPDLVRLRIVLRGGDPTYAGTAASQENRYAGLEERLSAAGFDPKAVKTVSFQIQTKYENLQQDGGWKQVFQGYEYIRELSLEAGIEELGRAAAALEECSPDEFTFVYTLRDPGEAGEKALALAVADARRKAEVLAEAAGVRLGQLKTVDHTFGARPVEGRVRPLSARAADAFSGQPEDVELSDSVTLIWEIG